MKTIMEYLPSDKEFKHNMPFVGKTYTMRRRRGKIVVEEGSVMDGKHLVKIVAMVLVIAVILTLGISGAAFASSVDDPGPGPAPSAGDGEPEGPEWGPDRPDGSGLGPAPNSGDGIPDGPGW